MINRSIMKYTTYLLIFLLLISPFTAVRADKDTPYITDPITGIQYADHPPPELLKGKSEQDQSRLLEWWAKEADANLKSQISDYYVCERELKKAKEQLADAEAGIDKKSEEYKKARIALNRKIVGLIYQLGLSTAVIMTDAAVDLYLAGKEIKEALKESSKDKERRISEAHEKTAQDKTNIAAKRDKALRSLEESFEESARQVQTSQTRTGKITGPALPPVKTGPTPTKFQNIPYEEVVKATGPSEKPWFKFGGTGKIPTSARVAKAGQKLVLDPSKGRYVWLVKENGNMVYAPQFESIGGVKIEVKHTDLGELGAARMGGEIIWNEAKGVWVMNNNSGRYSFRQTDSGFIPIRTEANLEAAFELVRRSGTDANINWEWRDNFPP